MGGGRQRGLRAEVGQGLGAEDSGDTVSPPLPVTAQLIRLRDQVLADG